MLLSAPLPAVADQAATRSDERGRQHCGIELALWPAQQELAVTFEDRRDLEQLETDHGAVIVFDDVALGRLDRSGRFTRRPDVEVQRVAALVEVVVIERDADDDDRIHSVAHRESWGASGSEASC